MANRFPLILDTSDNNQLKEIPAGDSLNLADVSVTNAHDITSLGVIAAPEMKISGVEVTPTNYLKKSGDIATYGGQQFKFLRVAANGTSIEFVGINEAGLFNGEYTGDLFPDNDDNHRVGIPEKRFAEVNAVNLKGDLKDANDNMMFDYDNGVFYIIENGKRRKMVSETRSILFSILF
jgi:hypothetical protein